MIRRLNGIEKLLIIGARHRPHCISVFHKHFHRFQQRRIAGCLLFLNPAILISVQLRIADYGILCVFVQRICAVQDPGIDPVHFFRECRIGLLLLRKSTLGSPAVLPDHLPLLIPVQILQI